MDSRELKYIFICSIMLALSFPPFPLGVLVPPALVLFMWFIRNSSGRDAFRLGYWLGLIWGAMTLFWIASSTLIGALLAISINALHYAILWWLYTVFRRRSEVIALISLPFLWTGLEYLRLFTDIRFNWMTLAYTQTYYLPFVQFIEWTGYLGISFILVVAAESIYLIFRYSHRLRWLLPGISFCVIIGAVLFGLNRMHRIDIADHNLIKAGLVQPNVDPYEKWDPVFQQNAFNMLMDASHQMMNERPELVVWPETATPFYLRTHLDELNRIADFTDSNRVFLLTGTPDYQYAPDKRDVYTYNAAFFFKPGQIAFQSYYKMALVPGSETMPFKKYFPFLRNWDVGGGDFFPGNRFVVFNFKIPDRRGSFQDKGYQAIDSEASDSVMAALSVAICYESVFPHMVRNFINHGANLLSIITNDGWFGLTSGPYQHARYAVYRAIENRVSIIRCANTGISCFIDPAGRVLKKAELNTRRDLIAQVPLKLETTYYSENGEWFGKLMLILSALFILFILLWKVFFRS
jgi:apolipoprotein N-acyltransferase